MTYIIILTLLCLAIAAALYFFAEFSLVQVGIFAAVSILVLNPLTYVVGTNIAKNDATTFNEYWSGYEVSADFREVTCTKNGPCVQEYQCDPYQVPVTKTRVVSDGRGGTTTETYIEMETRWNDCPYSTQETTYTVDSTLGDTYTVAANVMTGPPWRAGKAIPGGQVTSPPARWLEVKERVEAGVPGPVTAVNTYTNYILASSQTLFRKHEGEIEALGAEGLLPKPASGVTDLYHADKAYNVSEALSEAQAAQYTQDVAYLNGAVGLDLHGDVHVVFVPEDIALGPDNYSASLLAYWQSDLLGKNAISKNAIIVVLGVDRSQVSWARAFTGMPIGNEELLHQIKNELSGAPLDENLIGRPTMNLKTEDIVHSDGLLESLLWGENMFERVSMSGDGDDAAGFKYLMSDVQIKTSTYVLIGFINMVLVLMVGGILFYTTSQFRHYR